MRISTILTPAEIAALPGHDLRGTVCVVFDVLRATSTILAALANGAVRVHPVLTPEEAFELRRTRLPDALLGGERGGVRIEGFDLGNSPREYTADRVQGREIITTTTNGTVALRACVGAGTVLAAGLVNLDATAKWLRVNAEAAEVRLVCAGTGERFALEDGVAAGALVFRLQEDETDCGPITTDVADDATLAALALYSQSFHKSLVALATSENGLRLTEIGLAEDVAWCARTSVLGGVAVWRDGALEYAVA